MIPNWSNPVIATLDELGGFLMAEIGTTRNRILNAIPAADLQKIMPDLQVVQLILRQTICEQGHPLQYIYFPDDSLVSVVTSMADGNSVEVGMIGSEGLVGIAALFGNGISAQQVVVQVNGKALRMEAARAKMLFNENAAFRDATLLFFENFVNLAGQTAACNRLHTIMQRCARWLLMATDRMQSDDIPMTHEFLSAMLGTRRAGVTEIAGDLQRSGLIRYHHGQLTVVDRAGLAAVACECYQIDHMRLRALRQE